MSKSQHATINNDVPASDMIFTFHCTGWTPSGPSSSSLSPAVICSTPQPGPQTLCPRSQRRPVSTPETASPPGTTSAQTLASLWNGSVAGKFKTGRLFSKSISHTCGCNSTCNRLCVEEQNKTNASEKQYAVLQTTITALPFKKHFRPKYSSGEL